MEPKKFGHIEIPLKRIHIELTNVCNFNCVFCPKAEMKRAPGFMDTELAKKIITEIGSNGVSEKITFHVMGEPTLHRNFFEILEHAQHEKVRVGLTTNGAGLGGDIGKRLLEHDLYQVDVSLQTPDEKSFELRKSGGLSFEEYLRGIRDFFSAYSSRHKETIFKFRFLNTRFRNKGMEKKTGPVRVISYTDELRSTFRFWSGWIYDIIGLDHKEREIAMDRINRLVSYKWNVVEIYRNIFFETYVLDDWVNAFSDEKLYKAWAGYCFGMRDHFGILYNGDVVLCCVGYDGYTSMGNLNNNTLREILSSDRLGEIVEGFKKFRVVHDYCKRCLGSSSQSSWLLKPVASIMALKVLKPFFYKKTSLTG
jgi:MoaA/NifB/PqqE/SkfB family radical SAM enzyme